MARLESRFEELRELVQNSHGEKYDDTRDWLARILVVRSCGYVEQVVLEVQRAYILEKSYGLVKTFSQSWLDRSNNPTPERLLVTVGRFDETLKAEFNEFLSEDDGRRQRELDFLVNRRNKIAHGENESVNAGKALVLAEVAEEIANWFIRRFRPAN